MSLPLLVFSTAPPSMALPRRLLLLCAFLLIFSCAAGSASDDERAALMDLFASAGGKAWRNSLGWGSGEAHCKWFGVACHNASDTATGRISTLTLYDNLLEGTIPASLNALDEVTYFALSTNKLSGALPAFDFPRNQYFDMRYVSTPSRARSYESACGQRTNRDCGATVAAPCLSAGCAGCAVRARDGPPLLSYYM